MKIGVFDSGYGGLTILEAIRMRLPEYEYLYLGDNARAPYGTRSFEVIYEYTLEAVRYLQRQGCRLIILACNTASAKALRTIQQHDINPDVVRVLGVIRPTVEAVPALTRNGHIGIIGTPGTVSSESYVLELEKITNNQSTNHPINPSTIITQHACPLWVPLVESGEYKNPEADAIIRKDLHELLAADPEIDTLILGCTHYPLLLPKIKEILSNHHTPYTIHHTPISLISQGSLVADSLADYLSRHPEIEQDLARTKSCTYLTTESAERFAASASVFLNVSGITAHHVEY